MTVTMISFEPAKRFWRNMSRLYAKNATTHEILDYISSCMPGDEQTRNRYASWVETHYKMKYGLE